jgi:hypothetical protein
LCEARIGCPYRCVTGAVVDRERINRMNGLRRLWEWIRWPPPYRGPILSGRIDGFAYLLGWIATFAHLALWVLVLALGLHKPWRTVSTIASITATLLLLSLVIVIHRRMGRQSKLPKEIVWQWWLGPWDEVGRLIWLPVRLPEATRALLGEESSAPER